MVVRDVIDADHELKGEAWSAAILQSAGDAIIGTRPDGTIASWNSGAEQLFGYPAADVLERPDTSLIVAGQRSALEELRARALQGEVVQQVESEASGKDGTRFPVAITASPVTGKRGAVVGLSYVVRDISDRRRLEHRLQFFADHDPLTALFNRRRFVQELARHTAFIRRYQVVGGALLVCDLDNLKSVNDTFGHQGGDELLKAVASVLRDRLRDTDVLGRLGGDEFAVLLPRARLNQAAGVAAVLRKAVADIELTIRGRAFRTSVSIGIGSTTGTATPEELLAAADRAMYNAKRSGRNRVAVARNGLPSRTTARSRPERDSSPDRSDGERRGGDRFELYAQPVVELSTGKTRRYELVVRVPQGGRGGSSAATRSLLRTGGRLALIDEMDRYATRKALRLLASGRVGDAPLYVNVCGSPFAKRDILESLTDLRGRRPEAERLIFLIPEVAAVADVDAVREFMLAVQDLGCRVALSDFGRGFGSFACLKHLPVQEVKIHGSLANGMLRSPSDSLIVKALVEVALGMGIEPVAQQITGGDVARLLEEYGVRFGQGSYLGAAVLLKTTRLRERPRPTLVNSRRPGRAPSKTDT